MAAQHTQIETNKQEFRWSFRKKGKDVLKLCSQLTVVLTVAGGLTIVASPAQANPSGGNVTAGSATISSSGTTTTINQTSTRAIIEWNNFDIAAGETTQFIQPSTSSIALNRVVNSNQATSINGNLTATGRVLVINPNGVLIGPSGNVDVSGFVASTADINDTRFMTATGAMEFDRAGKLDASVENQGRITIRDAGLGLLVAPVVRNSGVIEGNMAKLQMGAGDTFGVDMYGDGLLHLAVGNTGEARTIEAENTGTIVAQAGKVVMTAAAANNVVNSVINTSGVIEAKGLVNKGGEIILTGSGANVKVAGKVDASGKTGGGSVKIGGDVEGAGTLAKAKTVDVAAGAEISANAGTSGDGGTIAVWSDELTTSAGRYSATGGSTGGNGGFVETSSKKVLDFTGTFVDTSAAFGAYGLWLLDPEFSYISSSNVASINGATSNVLIKADNISVDTNVNIANAGIDLKLDAKDYITFNDKTVVLNGGNFIANAKNVSSNQAKIQSNGGDVTFNTIGDGTIQLNGAVIDTKGGLFGMYSNNAIILNQSTVSTGGGNFSAEAKGSVTMNQTNVQTLGGNFTVDSNGAITMTGINVNTSGGTHAPTATFSMNSNATDKTFKQLFPAASNTLTRDGTNAGNVKITARGAVSGDRVCVTAGGSGCGYVLTPAKIQITIKAGDVSKGYGAVDPGLTYSVTYGSLNAGDIVTLVREAGENITSGGGFYEIRLGSLSNASNYDVTFIKGKFYITPKTLTITALDQGKTYGDELNLDLSKYTVNGLVTSINGVATGDQVSDVTLTSAKAGDKTVAAGTYANEIAIGNASGTGLSNYNIQYAAGTLDVAKAALIIAANNQTKTYGEAMNYNNGGPYTVTGLKNSDTVDTTSGQVMGGWLPQHDVGTYDINIYSATGTGLSNYDISFVKGTLTVTKAALTIAANNQTKVYGEAMNYNNGGPYTVTGLKSWDSVDTTYGQVMGGWLPQHDVGTYDINIYGATGTGLSNYDIKFVNGTLTVTKASLVITANNQTKTYGDDHILGTTAFTANGLKSWDSISGVELESAGAAATAAASPTTGYAITADNASGTGLGNYNIQYVDGKLTVKKAALTVTASNRTKTYGDTLALGNTGFTSSGLKNNDQVNTVTLNSSGRQAGANVGSYGITASNAAGVGLSNYTITYVNGTLVVNPATLTITARDQFKVYGDSKNVDSALLPVTISGLKNFDFVTDVNLTSAGGAATANVGGYDIVANGATGWGLSNYNINYVNGTLHVTPALLVITADSFSKTYGDIHNFDNTDYGVYGLKNADTVTGVNLASNGAAATANVGLYGIFGSNATGTGLSNYNIVYTPGVMLVNPAALTVTALDQSKTYGANHNLGDTAFAVNGLKNSDTVNTVALNSSGAAGTANAGSYAITSGGASGTGLSNYVISYNSGTLTVDKANLSVVANNQTKNFGSAFTFNGSEFTTVGTLYNGDTVSNVTLTSPGEAANASAIFSPYNIYASNATGAGLGNYNITYVNGQMTVNPAPYTPNVTFDTLNRPIVSVANKVIVRDTAFEGYETQTSNVDVALRYRGNTQASSASAGGAAAVLAALEPAAGGDVSAEDLANLEPAAGGDDTPAAGGNSDVDCANSFLDNQPCGIVQ